jgi:uncharacterized membrane protein YciS (DUF1049 family)
MPIIDGKLRELLEAAELLLEYGTAEDRYRVSTVLLEILGAGATPTTVEWGAEYLQAKVAEGSVEQKRQTIERARQANLEGERPDRPIDK